MSSRTPSIVAGFARVLRRERQARGLDQVTLAQASGLRVSAVKAMEAGRRAPTLSELVGLGRALEMSAPALVALVLAQGRVRSRR
jgi:ribosome-binding protein aMBF1 (putative translation factor)